ncbi:MAG: tellurium resistance protein TerC [Hyphomicrobiales bacterium]|nr:tellurium resistance protein TerC [Hyphomicrobiales bacterium]
MNIENLFTLAMLILLQAVLGFDNLLYISIESKRVAPQSQAMVRRIGIGLAIVLRIVLLFVVIKAIDAFGEPFAGLNIAGIVEAGFTIHSLIVLFGGGFIIYTAVKEIYHMLSVEDLEDHSGRGGRSVAGAILWIVAMNLVFSFDSILSALALTDVFWVMAVAIVISGVMMIVMADQVSEFLKKNRMYEVLGLFVLLIVGVMLVSEGGHLAHLMFFGFAVEPMAKTTFYFVLAVLVVVEIVQSRYQRKIMAQKHAEIQAGGKAAA